MRHKKFTHCMECGIALGKGNTSGRCRRCAMRERYRREGERDEAFRGLVRACREAGPIASGRVRNFLNEEKRRLDVALAGHLGTRLAARIPAGLQIGDVDRLWRREQHAASLPPISLEIGQGYVRLAYLNDFDQSHSADDIKRHFDSAIRRENPNLSVDWTDN